MHISDRVVEPFLIRCTFSKYLPGPVAEMLLKAMDWEFDT